MRVTQCYISKSVSDFPFREKLNLTEYVDSARPCLFIGCYTELDLLVILNHRSKAYVLWCGQDSIDAVFNGWHQELWNCQHFTWLVNVEKVLKNFIDIKLVTPVLLGGKFDPSELGSKVFAYCPVTAQDYHRIDIINRLRANNPQHQFIIGDGLTDQDEWLSGKGNAVYDQCFIGLVLSGFAGGGQTVIQMGMKGRYVVTNVIKSPNAYNWTDLGDIQKAIDSAAATIGQYNFGVATTVRAFINKEPSWLEI